MIHSVFNNIKIAAIATAVPKKRDILKDHFTSVFGEDSVVKFSKTTGVIERRLSGRMQASSDLAYKAAELLITNKAIDRNEIGLCIFVTQTPDYKIPATACVLHNRLGLNKDCMAFDINLGCSGYVYGMQVACSIMQSINSKYGLLLVGDTISKAVAPTDSASVMLFGDAGSATLLEKTEFGSAIETAYRTDGSGFKNIIIPAGAYRNVDSSTERVKWSDGNIRSDYDLYMNGVDVFSFTITEVPVLVDEFLSESKIDKSQFDVYAFHQANAYILKQLVKKLKLEKEKMHISMDRFGNTSVASIPLTICDKYGADDLNEEKKVLACGFGIGLSWGVAAFSVNSGDIFPIVETDDYYTGGTVNHD